MIKFCTEIRVEKRFQGSGQVGAPLLKKFCGTPYLHPHHLI